MYSENMGGIIDIEFLSAKEITLCEENQSQGLIYIRHKKNWTAIKCSQISGSVSKIDSGWNVSFSIRIPESQVDPIQLDYIQTCGGLVIKYKMPDKSELISGSEKYPLQVNVSKSTDISFYGRILTISGLTPYEPMKFKDI